MDPTHEAQPTAIVSPMPPIVPAWNVTPDALGPTVGANCRRIGIVDRRRGSSSRWLTEGVKGSVVEVGIEQGSLPSFGSRNGGETLRAAITHYNGNRLGQVTMSRKYMP